MKSVKSVYLLKLGVTHEINRAHYKASGIQEHSGNIQTITLFGENLSVLLNGSFCSKIDNESFRLDFLSNCRQLVFYFSFVSSTHYNVKALRRQLVTEFQADTITTSCDKRPRTTRRISVLCVERPCENWSQGVAVDETTRPQTGP